MRRRYRIVILSVLLLSLGGFLLFRYYSPKAHLEQRIVGLFGEDVPIALAIDTPYDPDNPHQTYKPFVTLIDPANGKVLTNGAGGFDSHHRGLFIGWSEVTGSKGTFDFWHMEGVSQRHAGWVQTATQETNGIHVQAVEWRGPDGEEWIAETRTLSATRLDEGLCAVDFQSNLRAVNEDLELRGDPHHAGMHVRLPNEVCFHYWTTEYLLPAGSSRVEDDCVEGAWWVRCSATIGGNRYSLVHLTHPQGFEKPPIYSIRRYGRFGAFFEPDLKRGELKTFQFRVVYGRGEISSDDCRRLYEDFAH
ncbi:MAG: PmoA family protein [Candidatus Omnitrophica bacterium]|nr:PmoA family protein [Candidatus Omnitrophota bacterium]